MTTPSHRHFDTRASPPRQQVRRHHPRRQSIPPMQDTSRFLLSRLASIGPHVVPILPARTIRLGRHGMPLFERCPTIGSTQYARMAQSKVPLFLWYIPNAFLPTIQPISFPATRQLTNHILYKAFHQRISPDLRGALLPKRIKAPATRQCPPVVTPLLSPSPRRNYFSIVLLAPRQSTRLTLRQPTHHT